MGGGTGVSSLLLSRLHYPVRNLGFGVRAGIWLQGCSIHCRGCIAPDTWEFDESKRCDLESVLNWLEALDGPLDGVTISGGEPTDQPEALSALLEALQPRRGAIDILLYSGRGDEEIRQRLPWLWERVDVLISEPFDAGRTGDGALRGSANQQVHRLSPLALERYPDATFEQMYAAQRGQIAVHVDQNSIWLVGIPKRGDLARLQTALNRRGVTTSGSSWLT